MLLFLNWFVWLFTYHEFETIGTWYDDPKVEIFTYLYNPTFKETLSLKKEIFDFF